MDVLDRDDLPFPESLREFQQLFPDEAACAGYPAPAILKRPAGLRVSPAPIARKLANRSASPRGRAS